MKGELFRKLAESSHASYEQDEWIFIRELVQNSRDSGADRIAIRAYVDTKGYETVVVHDNGNGMTRSDVESFLFRLYSSSKEADIERVGMFGVGFWTVLKYNPESILIESVKNDHCVKIVLDSQLNVTSSKNVSIKRGTGIALKRRCVFSNEIQFVNAVESAVTRYCRFATGTSNQSLAVLFNGKLISEPLSLDGGSYISFSKGDLKGVVGFSETPEVILMKGGIPLWHGRFLEELKRDFSGSLSSFSGPGLAPVFIIDGNGFESVISRKDVRQSDYLEKTVNTAEKALNQLIQTYTKQAFPGRKKQYWPMKISLSRLFSRMYINGFLKKVMMMFSGIILLSVVFYYLASMAIKDSAIFRVASPVVHSDSDYTGAVVDLQTSKVSGIEYTPPESVRFVLFRADSYDIDNGFIRSERFDEEGGEPVTAGETVITVTLNIPEAGTFFLPVPEKGMILEDSFILNNSKTALSITEQSGGVQVELNSSGVLNYQCVLYSQKEPLSEKDVARFTELPENIVMPVDLSVGILDIIRGELNERVTQSMHLTYRFCKPVQSQDSVLRFRDSGKPWLEKVIETGEGDCDVINGFLVLVLRNLGIPARLAVGYVGQNGTVDTGFHAWAEFYVNGWQSADLSELVVTEEFKPYFEDNTIDEKVFENGLQENIISENIWLKKISAWLMSNWFSVCLASVLIMLLILIKKIDLFKKNLIGKSPPEELQLALSKIMVRVVLQPSAWAHHREIFLQRVVPGINGYRYSLSEIEQLCSRDKCFSGNASGVYSRALSDRGYVVLDKEDRYFSNLISIINGVTDLTKFENYLSHSLNVEQYDFFKSLVSLFKHSGRESVSLVFSEKMGRQNLCNFSLPDLKSPEFFSGRVIVVNSGCNEFRDIAGRYDSEPILSLFAGAEYIIRRSDFFKHTKNILLNRFAEKILKEGHVD